MTDYFTRPTQSDRTRQAFNGGALENDLSRNVNQSPFLFWAVLGVVVAVSMVFAL